MTDDDHLYVQNRSQPCRSMIVTLEVALIAKRQKMGVRRFSSYGILPEGFVVRVNRVMLGWSAAVDAWLLSDPGPIFLRAIGFHLSRLPIRARVSIG